MADRMPDYRWVAPKFHVGQRIAFWWNADKLCHGEVYQVTTHYLPTGEAWHSYRCASSDHNACRWKSEEDMRPVPVFDATPPTKDAG